MQVLRTYEALNKRFEYVLDGSVELLLRETNLDTNEQHMYDQYVRVKSIYELMFDDDVEYMYYVCYAKVIKVKFKDIEKIFTYGYKEYDNYVLEPNIPKEFVFIHMYLQSNYNFNSKYLYQDLDKYLNKYRFLYTDNPLTIDMLDDLKHFHNTQKPVFLDNILTYEDIAKVGQKHKIFYITNDIRDVKSFMNVSNVYTVNNI